MKSNTGKKICLFLVGVLFFCWSCESNPSYIHIHTFDYSMTLRDRGHLNTSIVVAFENEKGLKEIRNAMKRIRYSLYMGFSSKSTADLSGKGGKARASGFVEKILKRQLKEKIVKVELINFEITEKQ